jgi:hypothetical protein
MDYYILKNKHPVPEPDVLKWGKWIETADRRVALTNLGGGRVVSTVFLTLDHSFGSGPPLLFESMLLDENCQDEDMERYSTWEEAEAGHARMVERAQKGEPDETD